MEDVSIVLPQRNTKDFTKALKGLLSDIQLLCEPLCCTSCAFAVNKRPFETNSIDNQIITGL
jgi:hypothetical protein